MPRRVYRVRGLYRNIFGGSVLSGEMDAERIAAVPNFTQVAGPPIAEITKNQAAVYQNQHGDRYAIILDRIEP